MDQFVETGHSDRPDDLDLLGDIGFAAVRYPVSWERVAPLDPATRDWSGPDAALPRLRAHGLRVIAGLVHHGSGPAYTSLLDPGFAQGVAEHARAAAERYPWIEDWTPINEPLTTARFSALYGHWYPHHRDEAAFWLALLNQIDATRLAMRAIRERNPAARLIQTEDLGRTYATSALEEQAAFDNTRRWMSFDLLCGLVVPGHSLWPRLDKLGLGDRLRAIAQDPCPPDIVGINHYLTSDRFLDDRVGRYPRLAPGHNEHMAFVDTEAVRVLEPPPAGLDGAIREAWRRYGLPVAVTEVHNGCTREEQLRWMAEAWQTATTARQEGIDVRAVTCWSFFGSAGWDRLLTGAGRYEPGAYDVSGPVPRPTALVPLLKSLASGGGVPARVPPGKGWWRRDIRLEHPAIAHPAPIRRHREAWQASPSGGAPPLLILGATGTLGRAVARACRHRDMAHVLASREDLNLEDDASIAAALARHRPWAVINAAGWVRVDDAEEAEEACFAANASGAARLAEACAARGIATVSFSSDLVFDGSGERPYHEDDAPAPLNAYGRSKAEAERRIGALPGEHLVVRTAAFFSPFDRYNFAVHAAGAIARGETFAAPSDQVVTPTYVPDLCNAVLDLVIDGETGLWHLTNEEPCSWAEFASLVASATGGNAALVEPRPGASFAPRAPRPAHVPLVSRRGKAMPSLHDALGRFARDLA